MSYSPTTFTRRVPNNPFVMNWIGRGGSASGRVISLLEEHIGNAMSNGLIYGYNGATVGIARMNLFVGDTLASVMTPIISEIGSNQDTNSGFILTDHSDFGHGGGLRGDGTSYVDTTVDATDLDWHTTDAGAMGLQFSRDHNVIAGFPDNLMGSFDGVNGFWLRDFSSTQFDAGFGLTTPATRTEADGVIENNLCSAIRTAQNSLRIYAGVAFSSLGSVINVGGSTNNIFIFARNEGSAVGVSSPVCGGYYLWKGLLSYASYTGVFRTWWVDMMQAFGRE